MGKDQRFHLFVRAFDLATLAIKWGLTALVLWWAISALRDVLIAFAGKDTNANVLIQLIGEVHADRWVAIAFGGAGLGYGYYERSLRRRNIKRLTDRNAELERRLNPSRSSSGLNPDGTTWREDR